MAVLENEKSNPDLSSKEVKFDDDVEPKTTNPSTTKSSKGKTSTSATLVYHGEGTSDAESSGELRVTNKPKPRPVRPSRHNQSRSSGKGKGSGKRKKSKVPASPWDKRTQKTLKELKKMRSSPFMNPVTRKNVTAEERRARALKRERKQRGASAPPRRAQSSPRRLQSAGRNSNPPSSPRTPRTARSVRPVRPAQVHPKQRAFLATATGPYAVHSPVATRKQQGQFRRSVRSATLRRASASGKSNTGRTRPATSSGNDQRTSRTTSAPRPSRPAQTRQASRRRGPSQKPGTAAKGKDKVKGKGRAGGHGKESSPRKGTGKEDPSPKRPSPRRQLGSRNASPNKPEAGTQGDSTPLRSSSSTSNLELSDASSDASYSGRTGDDANHGNTTGKSKESGSPANGKSESTSAEQQDQGAPDPSPSNTSTARRSPISQDKSAEAAPDGSESHTQSAQEPGSEEQDQVEYSGYCNPPNDGITNCPLCGTDEPPDGVQATFFVTEHRHYDCLSTLIQHGGKISALDSKGNSLMHIAARKGYGDITELLLEHGGIPTLRNDEGNSPVFVAVHSNHPDIVKIFMDHGAQPSDRNGSGNTLWHEATHCGNQEIVDIVQQEMVSAGALWRAVQSGREEVVRKALERHVDVNYRNQGTGHTLLHEAARQGHHNIVSLLIEHGADIDSVTEDRERNTVIACAVKSGNVQLIAMIAEMTSNLSVCNANGHSLVHIAVLTNNVRCLRQVLDYKLDFDSGDNLERTPLFIAAEYRYVDMAKALLDAGANKYIPSREGDTPFRIALVKQDEKVVALLAESGDNIPLLQAVYSNDEAYVLRFLRIPESITWLDVDGWTVLHHVVRSCHETLLAAVLQQGVPKLVNKPETTGLTPLHVGCNHPEQPLSLVLMLLEEGANPRARDHMKRTPLHLAAASGLKDVVQVLLNYDLNMDATDRSGDSPLNYAAMRGHIDVVKVLLQAGASTDIRNEMGVGAVGAAYRFKHDDVAALLRKHIRSESRCSSRLSTAPGGSRPKSRDSLGMLASRPGTSHSGFRLDPNGELVMPALLSTLEQGKVKTAENLVIRGAALDVRDPVTMTTPLHEAVRLREKNLVLLMIHEGADIGAVDAHGNTPLHIACMAGDHHIVKALTDAESDIHARNNKGSQPLHTAAENDSTQCVRFLIRHGADPRAERKDGKTALLISLSRRNGSVAKILQGRKKEQEELRPIPPRKQPPRETFRNIPREPALRRSDVQSPRKLRGFVSHGSPEKQRRQAQGSNRPSHSRVDREHVKSSGTDAVSKTKMPAIPGAQPRPSAEPDGSFFLTQ
eukprot:TRINITY_DN7081_c0_g1_i2.p1 TRINITY_DN7081_c0_g1~~TRINITY_DN7081_c0_g1_i2.p1  ORF type:complete len:1308 (+),score=122.01 TRINITY_DN7081_c0_g1_i2:275-4198(+)